MVFSYSVEPLLELAAATARAATRVLVGGMEGRLAASTAPEGNRNRPASATPRHLSKFVVDILALSV